MHCVWDQGEQVAAWVSARIPHMAGDSFGPCAAVGVVSDDGRPLAGVVFSCFQPKCRSIELSFAADTPKWLTPRLIREILSYPFGQLDCQRVTTLTPRRARPARRFLDTFGFKREGLVRKGFGDDDAVISGLLKTEWLSSRWMRHGQERTQGPDAARSHDGDRGAVGG